LCVRGDNYSDTGGIRETVSPELSLPGKELIGNMRFKRHSHVKKICKKYQVRTQKGNTVRKNTPMFPLGLL
jgi:hypothetical protein